MSTLPHDSFDANLPKVSYDAPTYANSFTSGIHLSDVRFLCLRYLSSQWVWHIITLLDWNVSFKDSKSSWFWWSPIFQHSLFRNLREVVLELMNFWIQQQCVDFGALGAQRMLIVGHENELCNQRPQRQMRLCYQVCSNMFICSWMFCTWFKSIRMYPIPYFPFNYSILVGSRVYGLFCTEVWSYKLILLNESYWTVTN
jgi:hypothetical protein